MVCLLPSLKILRIYTISFASLGNGREVILVNPYHTSKKCSNCGCVVDGLKLSDRVFFCPVCGWKSNRDYNASLNILKSGLEQNPSDFVASNLGSKLKLRSNFTLANQRFAKS